MRIALSSVGVPVHRVQASLVCQMPTSGRDNIIGKLKREPVANVTSDAVIGKVKYWKALFRFRLIGDYFRGAVILPQGQILQLPRSRLVETHRRKAPDSSKGSAPATFTPKRLTTRGTGQAGTQRAAEHGSLPIYPTTPVALDHC